MTTRPGTTVPLARVLAVVLGSVLLGGGVTLLVAQGLRASWAAVAAPGPARPADGLLLCAAAAERPAHALAGPGAGPVGAVGPSGRGGPGGRRGAGHVAPPVVRRLAVLALGAGLAVPLVAGTASAGAASTGTSPRRAPAAGRCPAAPLVTDGARRPPPRRPGRR